MSKEKDALSEAWYLPESKQEPIAWMHTDGDSCCTNNTKLYGGVDKGYSIPLYTLSYREPFSEEEISELWDKTINTKTIVKGKDMTLWDYILMFTRTIEQNGITGVGND